MTVRPVKTQLSLGIRPVWSESSLRAWWVANDQSFLHADNENSDQTGRMIWVFTGRTCQFVGFFMRRLKYLLQLSQLFKDGSLGNKINVVLVGLILLEGDEVYLSICILFLFHCPV